MRSATKKAQANLDKLAKVAGGRRFVIQALQELRSANVDPTLGDLLDHIMSNREKWWQGARNADFLTRGSSAATSSTSPKYSGKFILKP